LTGGKKKFARRILYIYRATTEVNQEQGSLIRILTKLKAVQREEIYWWKLKKKERSRRYKRTKNKYVIAGSYVKKNLCAFHIRYDSKRRNCKSNRKNNHKEKIDV
jgi:hypothetical protein